MEKRMFTRGGGRRLSSSGESLTEIAEDESLVNRSGFGPFSETIPKILDDIAAGKLYVAVGEDVEEGKSNLVWAVRNFLLDGNPKLVLLHVHQPAHRIMTVSESKYRKVSARQQQEKELKAYRKVGKEESNTPLNQYLDFCRVSLKIQAKMLVIKKNNPANGIIELIDQNHITSLVMGTSSFSPQTKAPNSKVAGSVHLQARPYCQIFYICNKTLACTSQHSTGGSLGFSLNSIDGSLVPVSVASSEEHQHSMVETDIQHEVFEQLHQARNKEASEGQQKTERDLFEASMMFKARENTLRKEKEEAEERLAKEKTGLEKEHIHICNKLQKAKEQRAELENKLLQANTLLEELKQLQVELQHEKDHAVRQAEQMRQMNGNIVFGSTGTVALIKFSFEEVKEATNDFGDSKKIGQGGYGSVYKGFLRYTAVAIKKINRGGTAGEKEFNDEVETMCRVRHPNLVTLIGVCQEAKALVFEFLPNGSLEDCLLCKHQREPLSWQMRIRIAADICTGLIFLHSNKPKGIAHGDLKPNNVLLDSSFVCKLADFGFSRPLNLTNTNVTPYHRTNQLKGTMGYMDPAYVASGELTAQSDVYSFGIVVLRLLTRKSPLGLPNEVEEALRNAMLQDIIDPCAADWPHEYAEELSRLALRCCKYDRKERPDLAKEAWGVLQAMMNCSENKIQQPAFFICPMTQEIMRDPHIDADGFTYEGEAIKDRLQRGHKMSPATYLSLTHHELIPNNALRFAIQQRQIQQQPRF